ncbi:hypothetical protein [Streptomyces sp. NPDC048266]|uniref:hypothetical protein n=1 Tax=Streptomyces sp. NPDC048266 TaxID=3155787 RepID=UPI0033C06FAD
MGQALRGTFLPAAALFGAVTKEQIDTWLPAWGRSRSGTAVERISQSAPGP